MKLNIKEIPSISIKAKNNPLQLYYFYYVKIMKISN